jgi:NAD-dependent SIR2 family protein deacetylase
LATEHARGLLKVSVSTALPIMACRRRLTWRLTAAATAVVLPHFPVTAGFTVRSSLGCSRSRSSKFSTAGTAGTTDEAAIKSVAEAISSSQKIVVMLGAGASVSAGIPDFRTPGTGLYDNLEKYNLPVPEAVFDIGFFQQKPDAFYLLCRELWPGSFKPTPMHFFCKLLHDKGRLLRVLTQNIDSLEAQAGLPTSEVIAAHGNFDSATCIATGAKVDLEEVREAVFHDGSSLAGGWRRLAQKHGGLVKPDIVFFGEAMPEAFFGAEAEDLPAADLLMVAGTSLLVQPFAGLVTKVRPGVRRVLINRERVGEGSSGWGWASSPYEREALDFGSAGGGGGGGGGGGDGGALVGPKGDVWLGPRDCDDVAWQLARELGWESELAALVEGV